MKKSMTLRDVQDVSLDILEKVHSFCVAHNIPYSLSYGTLIGAVRHKGFIPWDDDIDIMMLRPDYERFLSTFKMPGIGIMSQHDPRSFIFYSTVYDTEKTLCVYRFPLCASYSGGVAIDVFPIDYIEDDFTAFQHKLANLEHLWQRQMQCREPRMSFSSMPTLKKKLGLMKRKIVRLGGRDITKIKTEALRLSLSVPYGSTAHVSELAFIDLPAKNKFFFADDFKETLNLDFEGHRFLAIKGFDRFLQTVYGDYMQLPPPEKRVPMHEHIDFFWK